MKEIAQSLGPDHRAAYHAMRAVLHALRDRLTVDEAAHFGDELRMLVRGIYFDGLHSAGKPDRVRSREEFLQRSNDRLHIASFGPEDAPRAVFKVLVHHLAPGEIRRVVSELSRDIRALCKSAASAMLESAVLRVCARKEHTPAEKILPALRAIFGSHKEPQRLPTWHRRRRPIIRPKADCS
jgi:uncharacterized protein (DUF2267 family)